jgi:insulysin
MVTLARTKFRFKEKSRPDSYATWVAEHMTRPVPQELVLSAHALMWDWDGDDQPGGGGEAKVRAYLDTFRVENARVTLMATGLEQTKLAPNALWQKEPWYGTDYYVEKFDDAFIQRVRTSAQCQHIVCDLFFDRPRAPTTSKSCIYRDRTYSYRPTSKLRNEM